MLRNVEPTATEDDIEDELAAMLRSLGIRIYDCRVARDASTRDSYGYCLVQLRSLADAEELYKNLMRNTPPLTVNEQQG